MRARVFAAALALAAVPVGRAAAQTLQVAANGNNMTPSVAAPGIADFTTAGSSKSAGSVTFSVIDCPGGSTCTVRVSATTAPTVAANQLTWTATTPNAAAGMSCTASPVTSVGTSPAPVVACVASGNASQLRSASGITIAFRYPVTWAATAPNTYTTSGLQLRVSNP